MLKKQLRNQGKRILQEFEWRPRQIFTKMQTGAMFGILGECSETKPLWTKD